MVDRKRKGEKSGKVGEKERARTKEWKAPLRGREQVQQERPFGRATARATGENGRR